MTTNPYNAGLRELRSGVEPYMCICNSTHIVASPSKDEGIADLGSLINHRPGILREIHPSDSRVILLHWMCFNCANSWYSYLTYHLDSLNDGTSDTEYNMSMWGAASRSAHPQPVFSRSQVGQEKRYRGMQDEMAPDPGMAWFQGFGQSVPQRPLLSVKTTFSQSSNSSFDNQKAFDFANMPTANPGANQPWSQPDLNPYGNQPARSPRPSSGYNSEVEHVQGVEPTAGIVGNPTNTPAVPARGKNFNSDQYRENRRKGVCELHRRLKKACTCSPERKKRSRDTP